MITTGLLFSAENRRERTARCDAPRVFPARCLLGRKGIDRRSRTSQAAPLLQANTRLPGRRTRGTAGAECRACWGRVLGKRQISALGRAPATRKLAGQHLHGTWRRFCASAMTGGAGSEQLGGGAMAALADVRAFCTAEAAVSALNAQDTALRRALQPVYGDDAAVKPSCRGLHGLRRAERGSG